MSWGDKVFGCGGEQTTLLVEHRSMVMRLLATCLSCILQRVFGGGR